MRMGLFFFLTQGILRHHCKWKRITEKYIKKENLPHTWKQWETVKKKKKNIFDHAFWKSYLIRSLPSGVRITTTLLESFSTKKKYEAWMAICARLAIRASVRSGPESEGAFQFIPRLFSGVEVRALCKTKTGTSSYMPNFSNDVFMELIHRRESLI